PLTGRFDPLHQVRHSCLHAPKVSRRSTQRCIVDPGRPELRGAGATRGAAMFIRLIDDGLEKLLRTELPLPPDLGEVSFDAPNGAWAAQLSRLTVNLYLYDVRRSNQPVRAPMMRIGDDGRRERRIPLPMIRLSYLVSAWAGSVRVEHQLLGEVINRLAGTDTLPKEYLVGSPAAPIDLSFAEDPQ